MVMKKTSSPAVETSQTIVGQGSVPLAQESAVKVEAAPKGRMPFRGPGAMVRNKGFVVR